MKTCFGCDEPLLPSKAPGRERKWCSEHCRRTTMYVRYCIDCDIRLSSSDGNGPNAPVRCVVCSNRAHAVKLWSQDAIVGAIKTWAAEHDGQHPTTIDWGAWGHARAHADYRTTPDRWPSYHTVLRTFSMPGPWAEAVRAAGFSPRQRGRRVTQKAAA